MKRILITGANSYIGTSVERYLLQWPEAYSVDMVDMVDGSWREKSFSGYDVVFHVAGIAHQDSGSITEERKRLYYQVNTDLAIETAKKARAEGVRQFIFMSSISIYGASVRMGIQKLITSQTVPVPANAYGDSKLQAEQGILPLQNDAFLVCVLRPPMIYGPGCRGNYPCCPRPPCGCRCSPTSETSAPCSTSATSAPSSDTRWTGPCPASSFPRMPGMPAPRSWPG